MAESVVFNLASKILSTIASSASNTAYEKGVSIWEAKNELAKLQASVETIQAVLLDAEKKQEGSAGVKSLIKRLKGVLYDAEDLLDEVATEDLVKQQMMEGKGKAFLWKKVHASCFKLNPIVSRNSIAKKVKTIRERLDSISTDMAQFGFVQCHPKEPIRVRRKKYSARCSMDAKNVIGRDEDKKAILDMLISESLDMTISYDPIVIAIDGIGGMGKTTLAHMIYNDEKVSTIFEKRWFACISNTTDEIEVLGKICQVVCGASYNDLSVFQLEQKIRESINGKKYLLVLDDVWEDHRGRWEKRKSLLCSGANGSRIIVTTRLPSVVVAVGAVRAHNLKGLSEDDSWYLFRSLAFVKGNENDSERETLGRKILKRCRGLPLAIWCMGNLLHEKTIQEWREIERVGHSIVGAEYDDEIRSILKLSYDHLPSKLKQCYIYCCLFPKDCRYNKRELIYHWIAQGYIDFNEEESCFMHLLRMGFFQEVKEDVFGEIESCKMHDIMHDLALHLSGEDGEFGTSLNVSSSMRHVSLIVDGDEGGSWDIPPSLLNVKSIRSCMLRTLSYKHNQPKLDQLCSYFKLLRTLTLSDLGIEHIPPSIGELKLVRYLDLSQNNFEELPDSITKLVNLLVLNLEGCRNMEVWPRNFKKLIKLRFLKFDGKFSSMPDGIVEMDNLQSLTSFRVQSWNELDGLNKLLERVRGYLLIKFDSGMEVEDEWRWQLPATISLQDVEISSYPGHGVTGWGNNEGEIKLERLRLDSCENVKYLPPMSCLPDLKFLCLEDFPELEFLEEEEVNTHNPATSHQFFPCLKELTLHGLPKLKGWRRKVAAEATSTSLISGFHEAFASLEKLVIGRCSSLTSLHLASACLLEITIGDCDELMSIKLDQIVSLRYLKIRKCKQLKSLHIEAHLIAGLEEIHIKNCPELRLGFLNTQDKKLLMQKGFPHSIEFQNVGSELQEQSPLSLSMPSLKRISIINCKWEISLWCVELTSLRRCYFSNADGLKSLHIPSPHLGSIYLKNCAGLTGVVLEAASDINIKDCLVLKNLHVAHLNTLESFSMHSSSSAVAGVDWDCIPNLGESRCITSLDLRGVDGVFIERLLSSSSSLQEGEMSIFKSIGSLTVALTSLKQIFIKDVHGLKILNFKSPHLNYININNCNELNSVELESPHSDVTIRCCSQLKNVRIPRPISLQTLKIVECPELSLNNGVDWDSLPDLERLELHPLPPPEELPQCLLERQDLHRLHIRSAAVW